MHSKINTNVSGNYKIDYTSKNNFVNNVDSFAKQIVNSTKNISNNIETINLEQSKSKSDTSQNIKISDIVKYNKQVLETGEKPLGDYNVSEIFMNNLKNPQTEINLNQKRSKLQEKYNKLQSDYDDKIMELSNYIANNDTESPSLEFIKEQSQSMQNELNEYKEKLGIEDYSAYSLYMALIGIEGEGGKNGEQAHGLLGEFKKFLSEKKGFGNKFFELYGQVTKISNQMQNCQNEIDSTYTPYYIFEQYAFCQGQLEVYEAKVNQNVKELKTFKDFLNSIDKSSELYDFSVNLLKELESGNITLTDAELKYSGEYTKYENITLHYESEEIETLNNIFYLKQYQSYLESLTTNINYYKNLPDFEKYSDESYINKTIINPSDNAVQSLFYTDEKGISGNFDHKKIESFFEGFSEMDNKQVTDGILNNEKIRAKILNDLNAFGSEEFKNISNPTNEDIIKEISKTLETDEFKDMLSYDLTKTNNNLVNLYRYLYGTGIAELAIGHDEYSGKYYIGEIGGFLSNIYSLENNSQQYAENYVYNKIYNNIDETFKAFDSNSSNDEKKKLIWDNIFLLDIDDYNFIYSNFGDKYKEAMDYYLANVTDYRSNSDSIEHTEAGKNLKSLYENKNKFQDEYKIYKYLYNKEGTVKASEYLDSISDSVNSTKGMLDEISKSPGYLDSNGNFHTTYSLAGKFTTSIGNGLANFGEGLQNLISNPEDLKRISSSDYAKMYRQQWTSEQGKAYVITEQVGEQVGNQLPGIVISAIPGIGAPIGRTLTAASGGGQTYKEGLRMGLTTDEAYTRARNFAALELGLECVLGRTSNIYDWGAFAEKGLRHQIIRSVKNIGEEVLEEEITTVTERGYDVYYNNDSWDNIGQEMKDTFIITALTSGLFESSGYATNTITTACNIAGTKITATYNESQINEIRNGFISEYGFDPTILTDTQISEISNVASESGLQQATSIIQEIANTNQQISKNHFKPTTSFDTESNISTIDTKSHFKPATSFDTESNISAIDTKNHFKPATSFDTESNISTIDTKSHFKPATSFDTESNISTIDTKSHFKPA
ncbi:MAG: hypothetical protein J6B89_03240, partial [Bacilli bacterium]|nr:hypothetical protein [Bacilli bacterium]